MKKKEVLDSLNEQLATANRLVVRDMGLEVLPRVIEQLGSLRSACACCEKDFNKGLIYVNNALELLDGGTEKKKEFELWASNVQKHLEEHHRMMPKGRVLSLNLFAFMALGMLVGAGVSWWINARFLGGIVVGWMCGLFIGWVIGRIKEYKLEKRGLLY